MGAWVKGVLGAGLIAQMALCPRLWAGERGFPAVPVITDGPGWLSWPLLFALVLGVATGRAEAVLASGAGLALLDLNRLQPWFYEAMLLYGAVALGDRKGFGFVLAATYVWSGLQKANGAFAGEVFPWLFGERWAGWWPLAPVGEVLVGACLFWPRARRVGVGLAVAMHLLLLVVLGPWGRDHNSVVWPWNVATPALVALAFWNEEEPMWPVRWPFAALMGAMPALSFLGWWDQNLSASLYSGRPSQAFVLLTEAGVGRLPRSARAYVERRPDRVGVNLARWALGELNAPPYPEERAYREVFRKLDLGAEGRLVVSEPRGFGWSRLRFREVP